MIYKFDFWFNLKEVIIITIKKIAQLAGVSEGTVDRIIHNRGQVSQANIDKVNAIIKEHGYKKNIFASHLAFNKKFRFAVLVPDSKSVEYWDLPVKGIMKAAEEFSRFGVNLDYFYYEYNEASFKEIAYTIFDEEFDGLLIAPIFYEASVLFLNKCKEKNLKIVMIDSNISSISDVAFTGQNAYQSGLIAGRLSSFNLTRGNTILIVKITREIESTSIYLERIKGFYAFFKENEAFSNVDLKELSIFDTKNMLLDVEVFKNVSTIFVPNSRVYIIAEFLKENNLKDIFLVGYDLLDKNVNFLKEGYIDFLINQKPDEQGYLGIEYLYKTVILKENANLIQHVPVEIIVKESL